MVRAVLKLREEEQKDKNHEAKYLLLLKEERFLLSKDFLLEEEKKKINLLKIKFLEILKPGSIVDIKTLVAQHIVDEKDANEYGVKILGDGKITKSYIIKLPISKKAAEKIKKAGGRVEQDTKH